MGCKGVLWNSANHFSVTYKMRWILTKSVLEKKTNGTGVEKSFQKENESLTRRNLNSVSRNKYTEGVERRRGTGLEGECGGGSEGTARVWDLSRDCAGVDTSGILVLGSERAEGSGWARSSLLVSILRFLISILHFSESYFLIYKIVTFLTVLSGFNKIIQAWCLE